MKGKIRIKDIAKQANVSVGTVDRVIHDRGQVSKVTRNKIKEIINELGYKKDFIASALASRKLHNIYTLLPKAEKKSDYWYVPTQGIIKAKEEIENFGILVNQYFFEFTDKKDYLKKALKIIENKPDGILFAPIYSTETKEIISACEKYNILYAFINSYLENSNPLCYIGQDSFKSGNLAAKLLSYGVTGSAEFLIFNIARNIDNKEHILKRVSGFNHYFSENKISNVHIYEFNTEDSDDRIVNNILKETLHFYNNVKGIFVSNSKAFKVASYLVDNKIKNIRLVGYDLVNENIKYLMEGKIDFLISQKPEEQSYRGVISLFEKIVLKKEVQKVQYMPIDIITKENIEYYKNEKHDEDFFQSFK